MPLIPLLSNPDDKRRRADSIEIVEEEPTHSGDINPLPQESSLTDIKTTMDTILARLTLILTVDDLKNLASKSDLKEMDDRITAQSKEIGQLRYKMTTLRGNLELLQANVDNQVALNLAGGSRLLGRDTGYTSSNMAPASVNTSRAPSTQRRNLVIEGLQGL